MSEDSPGCVKRELSFMDRKLLLEAVEAYWRREAKGERKDRFADLKAMAKIKKVRDLVDADGMAQYYDAITDAHAEKVEAWRRSVEEWEKTRTGERPPRRPPKLQDAEIRGPKAAYQLPSKVDAMIQDAIQEMDWRQAPAEDVVLLAEAFGIKLDED